jgi:hypothetical protein
MGVEPFFALPHPTPQEFDPFFHPPVISPASRQAPNPHHFPSTRSFHGDNSLARYVPLAIVIVLLYNYKVNIRRGPLACAFPI